MAAESQRQEVKHSQEIAEVKAEFQAQLDNITRQLAITTRDKESLQNQVDQLTQNQEASRAVQ
jgi:hypothetical protein